MRAPTRAGSGPCGVTSSAGFQKIAINATAPKAAYIGGGCHLFMDVGRAWPGRALTSGRRIGRCLASILAVSAGQVPDTLAALGFQGTERKTPAWANSELKRAAIPSPV